MIFSRYSTSSDSNSDTDEAEDVNNNTKHRIFRASLAFVPEFGWSKKTLTYGAEAAGFPRLAHGMFPNGPADLISFFYQDCNSQLGEILKQNVEQLTENGEKPKTKEFVRNAVEVRLRMLVPYIHKWPQAMAIQTLPQNAVQSWSNLSDLVDEIWYHAGDRSTDFNWYTKRMSLAAVYKSTEITMVQDKSDDFNHTWSFLDRRLDNLVDFGNTLRKAQDTNSDFSNIFKGTLIMAQNVLGMNNRFR
ncbi:ubiquinone biosynthesis protein COQ9, mitochondrial-like [Liolophura sinensis]|uniref:ubiquinone biosynthesis protein COQ9, mitochondrial-like n=1 Tax=Liolophura sinensis TaxID=3198878 RepID=UPI003158C3C0